MSLSLHECSGSYKLGMTPMGEKESQLKTLLPTYATIEALKLGLTQSITQGEIPKGYHERLSSFNHLFDQRQALLQAKMETGTLTVFDVEDFSRFFKILSKVDSQIPTPMCRLVPESRTVMQQSRLEIGREIGQKMARDLPALVTEISLRMPVDMNEARGMFAALNATFQNGVSLLMNFDRFSYNALTQADGAWKVAVMNGEYLTPSIISTPTVPVVPENPEQPEIIFPVIDPKPIETPQLNVQELQLIADAKSDYDETDALSLIATLLLGILGNTGNFNADFKTFIHPTLKPMTISDYEGSDFRTIGVDSDLEIALNNLELHSEAKYVVELIKVFQAKESFIDSLPAQTQRALKPGTDRIKPIVERMIAAIELGNYDFGKDATDLRTLERQMKAGILAHTDLQNLDLGVIPPFESSE